MPEFHLSFVFRIIFLVLAAVSFFLLSTVVYHSTVPPVSSVKRYILITLRSLGLFFLFLLLGEPLLTVISHSLRQPMMAVLVDNTQSMSISDRQGGRGKTVKSILHSGAWKQINKNGTVKYSLFDAKIRNLDGIADDSLSFNGEATDIAAALKSAKQTYELSNLQAIVLITDGNSTVGMNPLDEAEELGVPVFTIGVGDTIEQKDLLIRNVLTNEIAYAGAKVPVNVTLHSAGFGGERVQLTLRDGAAILDEKPLTLDQGMRDYLVPLSFVTEKEGIQKFTAEVSTLQGELTPQNNRSSFFVKILKSKMRVAFVAGSPNEDAAFLRRALEKDKNIDLIPFMEQKNGQFYENSLNSEVLKTVDCIVLVGFPTEHSTVRSIQAVADAAGMEKPLFVLLGRTVDSSKLHALDPVLPFRLDNESQNEIQIFAAVVASQRNNPVLKNSDSKNIIDVWSSLPPVFRMEGTYRPKIGSEVLATIRFQSSTLSEPFIVAMNVDKKKSLAVLGYGLWRWNMLSDAGSGTDQMVEHFIGNSVRWLTTQEDARKIRIQPSKRMYTAQEAVEFTAQVYDDNFQPLDDAQVEVRIHHGSETSSLLLNALGSGQYQGEFESLPGGEYQFTSTVTENGAVLGTDQGTFTIGGLNAEFFETRMNKSLLQQIAARTGGRYYDSHDLGTLADDVSMMPNFKPHDVSLSAKIEIWNSRWMLALVVFSFALEWFLRKQSGML